METAGSPGNGIFDRGNKFFELSNHLGNVLATVSDRRVQVSAGGINIDYYLADVVSASDSYPFGMEMPGRNYSSGKYRYGFNGKEKDKDISLGDLDFGDRIYDNRIARWYMSDRKESEYEGWSPYHFGYNNPIVTIDPDGEENIVIIGANNHDATTGNKLMFMVQGISQAKSFSNEKNEKTTVLLFTQGYTKEQIAAFKKSAKENGAKNVIEITNVNQVINYINSKNTKVSKISKNRSKDKVTDMAAFSHGVPGKIDFDYDGGSSNTELNSSNIKKINKKAFGKEKISGENALFVSYACQTGNVDEGGVVLAQKIADHLGIDVLAFKRRSDYVNTFSFPLMRELAKARKIDGIIGPIGAELKFIKEYGTSTWKYTSQLLKYADDPMHRKFINGFLFDDRGAFGKPKSGDTPSDRPAGQFLFKPKKSK
jgi:RHS repeat-associated protein